MKTFTFSASYPKDNLSEGEILYMLMVPYNGTNQILINMRGSLLCALIQFCDIHKPIIIKKMSLQGKENSKYISLELVIEYVDLEEITNGTQN